MRSNLGWPTAPHWATISYLALSTSSSTGASRVLARPIILCLGSYVRKGNQGQFLSLGVILRRVVYHYAENRCNNKDTDEEREAINARIGKVGIDYKVIAEAIEKYRESDSGNELMTNLEILIEIAPSLKGKVQPGAITGYKKLLELSEQADLIDEMVNEYHMREGSLTKRECFNAIKDTLPISFTDKPKNVYQARLAFEKQREDIKTISNELALAKNVAKAAGGEVDLDKFFEEVRRKYGDISNEAIEFVAGREKKNNDSKTIYAELARAKKDAKAAGGEVDLDKFFEQVRRKYSDISNGAIEFVAGREKKKNDVKTIYAELARAKKEAKEAGGEVDFDTFSAQLEHKNGGISIGAIALVAGREKHHNDVKAISEEVARAKKEVAQFRRNNPNATNKNIAALINNLDVSEGAKQRALSDMSVLPKKKRSLTAVINSVEKAAEEKDVSVNDIEIWQYKCVECAKNRRTEYNDFFHVVAFDIDGNKQLKCFLCSRQESVRSGHFTRVGQISIADVIAERKSLDMLSKQQRQKKKPQMQKKRKATKTMKLADHVNGSPLKKRRKNASHPPEAVESTKSSLHSSSAVVMPSAAFEKISDGRQLYVPALLQISVPPIPEYVPPLPLCVGSQATVDRNDVVPLPQPGHRVSINPILDGLMSTAERSSLLVKERMEE